MFFLEGWLYDRIRVCKGTMITTVFDLGADLNATRVYEYDFETRQRRIVYAIVFSDHFHDSCCYHSCF